MALRDLITGVPRMLRRATAGTLVSIRRTTPGQYWTSALALLVTLPVLLFGLPPATTLVEAAPTPQPASGPPAAPPPTDVPGDGGIVVPPPHRVVGPGPGPVAGPTGPGDGGPAVTDPLPATSDPGPAPPSSSEACPPAEAVEPVLEALAGVEFVPQASIVALIGALAGCSEIDPTIFPIALLAETGSGLPDPGLEVPLPAVPFVEIPLGVVDLAQPLRDVIQPLCDAASLASPLILIGLSSWPTNVDQVLLIPVGQVLLVCGQLLAPEAIDNAGATNWPLDATALLGDDQ